jgi:hypothetical protein
MRVRSIAAQAVRGGDVVGARAAAARRVVVREQEAPCSQSQRALD